MPRKIDRIRALDAKYTGEEPIWEGWQDWPVEKFWKEKNRAFSFYNYYTKSGQLKPAVLDWMEANGYAPEQVKLIEESPDYIPGPTVCTLCHCLNRGMPDHHPEIAEYVKTLNGFGAGETLPTTSEFIRKNLDQSLVEAGRLALERSIQEAGAPTEKQESPLDKLRRKVVSTIFLDLDLLIDEWVKTPLDQNIRVISTYEKMNEHGLPAMAVGQVTEKLDKLRQEMALAFTGEDEYLKECYSVYPRPRLKEMITALTNMIMDLSRFKHAKKAERKPRAKKTRSAEKQVERLKYLKHSEEHRVSSVQPTKVPGSYQLWVFNVKYRTLAVYTAANAQGLQVQGTSVKNFEEKTSVVRTLRKPEQFLPIVLDKTPKALEKAFSELTTTARVPNGRVNEDSVLLRVIDSR